MLKLVACNQGAFSDPAVQRLAAAAENGDVKTIDELIRNGVNPNARGLQNVTPLLVAFFAKNKAGFDALLRAGSDPNLFDDRGRVVMFEAASEEDAHWLEQSLKHGGNPNLFSPGSHRTSKEVTPIFYAVEEHRGKNLKLLIDAGADINHMHGGGVTVVRSAVERPAFDMLYILVEAGADFRKKDAVNVDLLDLMSSRNEFYVLGDDQKIWFRKTVELLKSKGAKFSLRDDGK